MNIKSKRAPRKVTAIVNAEASSARGAIVTLDIQNDEDATKVSSLQMSPGEARHLANWLNSNANRAECLLEDGRKEGM